MEDDFMEFNEDLEEDPRSKCRLCAKEEKSKYLINIFGSEGRKYAVDIKIRKCLPIMVRENDGMPKGICITCLNKLEVSADLIDSALQAHHTFLAVMAHDPTRAKLERSSQQQDNGEVTENEDASEVDIDQLSEAETLETETFETPVVIKDEHIDLDDEVDDEITDDYRHSTENRSQIQSHLLNVPQNTLNNQHSGSNTPNVSENDGMSNVVVASVNSISSHSPLPSSLSNQDPSKLPGSQTKPDPKPAEQNAEDPTSPLHSSELTIKEEPLGSPQQVYSPLTSENEQQDDAAMPYSHDEPRCFDSTK